MAKRFISPDWKELRKLSASLKQAYFYCWDKADACGVYEHDPLYMKADLGISLSISELKKLPGVKVLDGGRIFFTDFILINYGELKEGYNPHKPAFRALEKNKISSLNQACFKLEEEEEGEDEDKEEDEEEIAKEKRQKIELVFPYNSPEFMQLWSVMAEGPKWKKKTKTALQASLKILSRYPERVAIGMMEKCIAGNWQGLVEPNKNELNGTTKTEYGTPERAAEYDRLFAQRYGGR